MKGFDIDHWIPWGLSNRIDIDGDIDGAVSEKKKIKYAMMNLQPEEEEVGINLY